MNTDLRDQLEVAKITGDVHQCGDNNTPEIILRLSDTVGAGFSIQIVMGLGGTGKKYEKYKAIQVGSVLN